jgi:hypothetical protein
MLLRILFFFFLSNSLCFAQSNWSLISEDKISDIVKNRENNWRFYTIEKKKISDELSLIKFDNNITMPIELILPNEKRILKVLFYTRSSFTSQLQKSIQR